MSAFFYGAERGVRALYRDHHGWLQTWLHRKLGNAFDAADLAHDTFVRILVAHGGATDADADADEDADVDRKTDRELREPRAYLTTVASRLMQNLHRRRSLERAYLDALSMIPEAHAPSPEERVLVLETLHEVDVMLDGLAPKTRLAFLLAQLEGMTYAEIAAQMQVNVRTVKRYMAAAYEACILLTA